MAAENFDRVYELVLGHEGGWGDDPHDRGNWTTGVIGKGQLKGTKYGIAAHAYPTLDIKNLTLDDAKKIYRRDYWGKVRCDDMPLGVDYCLFDGAVNSGWFQSAKWLQRAVGVAADGKIGPLTMKAVAQANGLDVINRMCDARLAFLQGLSTWARYGKGWGNRVRDVRTSAKHMFSTGPKPVPVPRPTPTPLPRPRSIYVAGAGGLWGFIYSTGMKDLRDKFAKIPGCKADYFSRFGFEQMLEACVAARARGDDIVLFGHSMGADLAVRVARALNDLNIPVYLLACFDPTEFGLGLMPPNVRKAYCFSGDDSGLGDGVLKPERPQDASKIVVEIIEDKHIKIDNSERLHNVVLAAARA